MKTNTLDFDAQALRERILDLAMRGKLVPQDPNDEPASVLLEKIKAEKEHLVKEKKIKRSKPLPKITDDEKPFDIPDSWEWVRLGDVLTILRGGSPRPIKNYLTDDPNGINWIKIGDSTKNSKYIDHAEEKIIPEGLKKTREVHKGDFLLSNSMSFGRPYILKIDGAVHDGWLILSNYDQLFNKDYLYYLLSSNLANAQFTASATGSTVKNLNRERVASTIVVVPPLSEQSRIAAKIAQLFALLRKVESSTQQYAELQTLLKSKVLDLAMRGKLVKQDPNDEPAGVLLEKIKADKTELVKEKKIKKSKPLPPVTDEEKPFDIPDNWEWVRLGDILKPEVHQKPQQNFTYIDIASVDNTVNKITKPTKVDVSKDKIASRARQLLDSNDILFSVVRPYLKNVAMVPNTPEYKIGSTGFYVLKPFSLIDKKYIFYLVLSNYVIQNMTRKMKGDNSPSIRKGDLQNLVVPLPPILMQTRIVKCIEKIYSYV